MSTLTSPRTDACVIAATVAIAALACGGSAQARTTPAAPGALQVTARTETSLSLQWKDRSRGEAYYKVRVSGRVRRLAANRQAVTLSGLRPGVAYRIFVQACSGTGQCSKAATDMATTASARPARAPLVSQPGPGIATEPAPAGAPPAPASPPAPAPAATVDVSGTVTVTTGNCMPTIGDAEDPVNPCRTSPAAGAQVLVYGPVLTFGTDLLDDTHYRGLRSPSAQATTDAAGRYHLVLAEPGTYSFTVDTGDGPECGLFDANMAACPHALLASAQTVDLNVNHAVW